ncbi:FkbM family methyltransferase [Polynucleobacter paneuropaeus]|nr:FkbM family methyltransferase [Polynucleobacter paneuropaeus]
MLVNNFTVIDSIHGKFVINRHCAFQAEALIKTGQTHIESELKTMHDIANILPANAVAIDAGANIGFVTIPLSNWIREKNGVVHAFEVQRMLFYALCGTVALNDISNVVVHNKGLGSAPAILKVPTQNYGVAQDFGTVSLRYQDQIQEHESVEIIKIDDLNLERLDFLKIDVEGMELEVLAGARQTIEKYRPWCWIEYWMVDKELLKQVFMDLDYELYTMDQLNVLCAPREKLEQSQLKIDKPIFE